MNGRFTTRWPKEIGSPPQQWENNRRALRAAPRKGSRRKWFVYGVEVNKANDWVTEAKNTAKWHTGVEGGAEEFEMRGDALTNESRTAVTIERLLRRGLLIKKSFLTISVVYCVLVGRSAVPPGICLYLL